MEKHMEWITDNDGKRFFTIVFKKGDIPNFKQHILATCESDCFLPMHFIDSAEGITAFYRMDGFISLQELLTRQEWFCENTATTLCRLFSMILRRLMEAEDLFLDLDDLLLDLNSVFLHAKERNVKLAYQSRVGIHPTLQKSFLELLKFTTEIVNDEQWNAYSEKIQRQAIDENLGLTGILKSTTEQSRCILERKWPVRENLRG